MPPSRLPSCVTVAPVTNGKQGGWMQWALGIIIIIILGWLSGITAISQSHTPRAWTTALETRMRESDANVETRIVRRLDRQDAQMTRIEDRLDRLVERD